MEQTQEMSYLKKSKFVLCTKVVRDQINLESSQYFKEI